MKTCATCVHLIGRRAFPEHAASWKCGAPQNISSRSMDAVTGEEKNSYIWSDCYSARLETLKLSTAAATADVVYACGPDGLWWEEYKPPQSETMAFVERSNVLRKADALLDKLTGDQAK